MSLRVWGRPSVAPSNLLTKHMNSRPQTKNTSNWFCVKVSGTWLLLLGVDSPLPSPSLLVPALSTSSPSPSQTHLVKQIWSGSTVESDSNHLSALVVSWVDGGNAADFHLFKKQIHFSDKCKDVKLDFLQGGLIPKSHHLAPTVVGGCQLMMQTKGCCVQHLRQMSNVQLSQNICHVLKHRKNCECCPMSLLIVR